MPRKARIVIPNLPYHVTQCGNNRLRAFFAESDYRAYLSILAEQADLYGLTIHGYCLMPNHIHLLATPAEPTSLAKAVGRTHFTYTQTINRRHKRSGHLWQNRFFSCALDKPHFWRTLRYIERNPVRAKITRVPWTYGWSSAALHCDAAKSDDPGRELIDLDRWAKLPEAGEWKETLRDAQDENEADAIRRNTRLGRPLGSPRFMSGLERKLGRSLRPLAVGRPRKV